MKQTFSCRAEVDDARVALAGTIEAEFSLARS